MGRGTPGLQPRSIAGLECEPGSLPNLEVPVVWNQHFLRAKPLALQGSSLCGREAGVQRWGSCL